MLPALRRAREPGIRALRTPPRWRSLPASTRIPAAFEPAGASSWFACRTWRWTSSNYAQRPLAATSKFKYQAATRWHRTSAAKR